MAIYRFEAKVITRGSGRSAVASASYRTGKFANGGKSAVAAAAYRAGTQLVDERTGQRADYGNKQGVLGAEIMVPTGAVLWMQSRQALWNAVEAIEKRRDAQLARDFILTLPHELSQAQRVALTKEFVREQFCNRGFVADIAWHAPGKGGDERNHHAHVMVPMRRIEGHGFTRRKDRPAGADHPAKAWTAELARLRAAFAEVSNRHLAAAGLDIRVDHRSLAERGIDREPEPKQGPLATQIERQGRASLAGTDRREVQARNGERAALRRELAAAAAEEARITDLMAQRSGEMKPEPLTDDELRRQHDREAAALATLRQQEQQAARDRFTRAAEQEAEEAKRKRGETVQEEARRRSDGEIASAPARYHIALGDHYDVQNPYGSLARAAMADYGAFVKEQDRLRQEIAHEPDREKRQLLELRRQIEGHDWMAATSQRLAGISAALAGREDAPQAKLDREQATAHAGRSAALREERAELIAAREERERPAAEPNPDRSADPVQRQQAGRAVDRVTGRDDRAKRDATKEAEAQRSQVTGRAEGDAELSDAQRAKLDRLQATRAAYAEHTAQKQKDRDRGGGGRSR